MARLFDQTSAKRIRRSMDERLRSVRADQPVEELARITAHNTGRADARNPDAFAAAPPAQRMNYDRLEHGMRTRFYHMSTPELEQLAEDLRDSRDNIVTSGLIPVSQSVATGNVIPTEDLNEMLGIAHDVLRERGAAVPEAVGSGFTDRMAAHLGRFTTDEIQQFVDEARAHRDAVMENRRSVANPIPRASANWVPPNVDINEVIAFAEDLIRQRIQDDGVDDLYDDDDDPQGSGPKKRKTDDERKEEDEVLQEEKDGSEPPERANRSWRQDLAMYGPRVRNPEAGPVREPLSVPRIPFSDRVYPRDRRRGDANSLRDLERQFQGMTRNQIEDGLHTMRLQRDLQNVGFPEYADPRNQEIFSVLGRQTSNQELLNEAIGLTEDYLRGSGLKSKDMQAFLANSYDPNATLPEGWRRDNELSNKHAAVLVDGDGNAVIAHRGTKGTLQDWTNNAIFGMTGTLGYRQTARYRMGKNAQERTEAKYGAKNVTTIGHSQGGLLAEELGKNSKEIITFNKATRPKDILKRQSENQTDVRSSGDLVSAATNPMNKTQTIAAESYVDPIEEHDIKVLDRAPEKVGSGPRIPADTDRSKRVFVTAPMPPKKNVPMELKGGMLSAFDFNNPRRISIPDPLDKLMMRRLGLDRSDAHLMDKRGELLRQRDRMSAWAAGAEQLNTQEGFEEYNDQIAAIDREMARRWQQEQDEIRGDMERFRMGAEDARVQAFGLPADRINTQNLEQQGMRAADRASALVRAASNPEGSGKKLTKRQLDALARHSKHHTGKHMDEMVKLMKGGVRFREAHRRAMKSVGK